MKVLSSADMSRTDARTASEFGIPLLSLMENAGRAVARFVREELPECQRVVVLCGRGNNGGDGFVAARHLAASGCSVTVVLLGESREVKGDAQVMLERLTSPVKEVTEESALADPSIRTLLEQADVFVDAVVGTGFKPPLRKLAKAAGEMLAEYSYTPVIAVDLPSGWESDSREASQKAAYRADAVVTFTAPKLAHVSGHLTQGGALLRAGNLQQGPIVVAPIGSPDAAIQSTTGLTWAGTAKHITDQPRNQDGNKGQFGHVLLIGGADGKAGAPAMASLAALRAGAGLVTAGVVSSILPNVAAIAPELMTEPLLAGSRGAISAKNLEDANLQHLLEKKTVIAIGPGLSQDPDAQDFVLGIIERTSLPMVIDADALNAIAERRYSLDGFGRTMVLTPHPGEMARLVGKSIKEVQAEREAVAHKYATEHHVTLVLKGWRTIIAHPDGRIAINTTGNPGLAKGGSGDILTGIVAAMVAQYKQDAASAVEAAVYLHGLAADIAVAEQDQHTLLATDVVDHLWKAFRFRPDKHEEERVGALIFLQSQPGALKAGLRKSMTRC